MKQHKFRAWDKIHNCYLPIDYLGCFVWGNLQCGIPADPKADSGVSLVFPTQPDKGPDYFGRMFSLFCSNDIVLEQWTGQRDSKRTQEFPEGQEIYENDRCKAIYRCHVCFDNEPHEIEGIIEWDDHLGAWMLDLGHTAMMLSCNELDDIEVLSIQKERE